MSRTYHRTIGGKRFRFTPDRDGAYDVHECDGPWANHYVGQVRRHGATWQVRQTFLHPWWCTFPRQQDATGYLSDAYVLEIDRLAALGGES